MLSQFLYLYAIKILYFQRNDKIEAGLRAFNVVPYIGLPATCDTAADGEGRTVVDKTVSSVSEAETATDSSTGDEQGE